jgi:hypothetical protein
LNSDGAWTYVMNDAHEEFVEGVLYSDSFVAEATDGTKQTVSVFIKGTNDQPWIIRGPLTLTQTFTEGPNHLYVDSGITLGDRDGRLPKVDQKLSGAVIQITEGFTDGDLLMLGSDVDGFVLPSTMTSSYDALTHTLTISGTDTVFNYQTVLRSVNFYNARNNLPLTSPDRKITIQTIDTSGVQSTNKSDAETYTVKVVGVNSAPVVTMSTATAIYIENGDPLSVLTPSVALSKSGTVSLANNDDGENLISASVLISGGYQVGDTLSCTIPVTVSGVTAAFDIATHTLNITGAASVADYTAILNSVKFFSSIDRSDATLRLLKWNVTDALGVVSNTGQSNVNFVFNNDAPVLATEVDRFFAPMLVSTTTQLPLPVGVVGTLLSDLLAGVTDKDFVNPNVSGVDTGVTLVNVNAGLAAVYYTKDNGATWGRFLKSTTNPTFELPLIADANTRLYIRPFLGVEGVLDNVLTIRAWDHSGMNPAGKSLSVTADTVGGSTEFSLATDTISVVIADVIGTSGVDTVTGTTGSDVILANGGADVITTGDGNDTVVLNASNVTELSATNAMLIDGGAGVNLLRLVSAPGVTLDLSAVAAKVTHFSVVDVTGNGNNTVKLSLNDVLNLSGAVDNAATVDVDESKMVVVKGEAGDVLNLTDRVDWQAVTTGELGASLASTYGAAYGFAAGRTYTHYSQGGAHLYVDELITHPA